MNYAETLSQLSNLFLKYQKEERDIFLTEKQRQEDGVVMLYSSGDFSNGRSGDVLYDQFREKRSYICRRLKILKYYIKKLVNSGCLGKRDYRYLKENGLYFENHNTV